MPSSKEETQPKGFKLSSKFGSEKDLWISVFLTGYREALKMPLQVAPPIETCLQGCAAVADRAVELYRKRQP